MSNFTIDMGDPNFRTGAFIKYLGPLADTLAKTSELDIKFLLAKHTFESIKREAKSTRINSENSFTVDYQNTINVFGIGDWFIQKSYENNFDPAQVREISDYFERLFNGWKPDVIICWEFPTTFFRSMFPDALVLDLMPGLFMRPPFPRTISFDPMGLYKDSVFGTGDLSQVQATDSELETYYRLRNDYDLFFEENKVKALILSKLRNADNFQQYILVPLQISQYFGFYANCKYSSQFEFLLDVLNNTPKDIGVIATQYISGFVQDTAINDKNIDFLNSNFSNFLYSKEFELVDNISQFIVPWADGTCSISSTIGLQCKFFNRKLISPSRSHLSYLADQISLNEGNTRSLNNDHLMAIMLSRQVFLEERLLGDPEYLMSILVEMFQNFKNGKSGIDLLPEPTTESSKENYHLYMQASSPAAANRQLGKLGHTNAANINNDYLKNIVRRIKEEASLVSFDVFDTLLCRSVFKPEDVFLMMQKELQSKTNPIQLPSHISHSFAVLRAGVERQLRRERDAQLQAGLSADYTEEITIEEVYSLLIERFGGDREHIFQLIELEQKLELSVLQERPVGKYLFQEALKAGKPILIVSDFIHDETFVVQALRNAGYTQYDKIYVSSKIGKKKHSGDLFAHIAKEIKVDTKSILHIGDNSIGDLSKAQEAGWNSIQITSARERAIEIMKTREISPEVINKSFFLRSALSMFAEEFYQIKSYDTIDKTSEMEEKRGFLENEVEFGYLALGPIMVSFSDWIIQQAMAKNCTSIVCFARDCYLPYHIINKILSARGKEQEMDVHYIATSRKGLMGMNIYTPEDFLTVRIDDFARKNPFSSLVSSRFGLDPTIISRNVLERWNVTALDTPVGKLTPAAIYGVIYEHALEKWDEISKPIKQKREAYKKYLIQEGVDLSKKTLGVDFGYKGTTHKMINSLFEGGLESAFFMTFADDFGQDPIENAESYYKGNVNSAYKTGVMLSHNLIIETLVNEANGSLIEVSEDNSEIRIIKEELGSAEHLSKINAIHRGVLQFADRWLKTFKDLPELTSLESNSGEYILTNFLLTPSKREARILKGLVFDNAYAGHSKRYILAPKEGYSLKESIWKEGHQVLYLQEDKGKTKTKPKSESTTNGDSPVIKVKKDTIEINGEKYAKSLGALRSLYRDTFVDVVSALAKNPPSAEERQTYVEMIENNSKMFVAAKLLQDHGGIANANINSTDKMKALKKLMLKK